MHFDIDVYSGNEFFWECLRVYWSTFSLGIRLVLAGYLLLLVLILIWGTRKERLFFLAQLAVLAVVPLNPIVAWQLVVHLDFATRYFRLFWMIPVVFTYAYVCVQLYDRLPKLPKRLLYGLVILFLCYSCYQVTLRTKDVYTGHRENTGMMAFTNIYKVEDDVVQAADAIEADAKDPYAEKRVLYDYDFYMELRVYDGSITFVLRQGDCDRTRELTNEEYQTLLAEENWKEVLHYQFFNLDGSRGLVDVKPEDIDRAMDGRDADYAIVPKNNTYYAVWLKAGKPICETEYYTVIKNI